MGFFDIFKKKKKMSDGLEKTRTDFFQNIVNTLTSSVIDDDLYNDLEEQLILADVGPSCAVRLVDELRDEVEINGLHTGQEALDALRDIIRREVSPKTDLDLSGKPAVILVVGVNGVGKTTTIAKLAYLYKDLGKRVMLAAGDTFRAAASEQLETWADRAGVPLVKAGEGADPAAVIFDAVKSATARGYDMVIADTAGRLHNKKGLMDELAKISRSVKKASPDASLEVLLVLDAITGQNAISQAQEFCRAAGATGVVLTKLDGTPKGGCIIGVHEKLGLPIRFVGVGEKIDDLIFFSATDFAEALLPEVPQHKKRGNGAGRGGTGMIVCAATNNAGKLKELRRILTRCGHEVKSLRELGVTLDPEETGTTFAENAKIKAEAFCKATGLPTVADDSGLCVDALNGAPGVYSARYAGEHGNDAANNEKLMAEMQNVPVGQRAAKFVSAVCLILPDGRELVVTGECPGSVALTPAGDNGFGYDPLFVPDAVGLPGGGTVPNTAHRTYAELADAEKDAISHRGRAMEKLEAELAVFFGRMSRREKLNRTI